MTIEEMIELLDVTRREWSAYVDGFDSKEHEKFDQIIAALHAGQAMFRTAEAVLTAVNTRPYAGGQQVQNLLPPHLQDPLQEAWEAWYSAAGDDTSVSTKASNDATDFRNAYSPTLGMSMKQYYDEVKEDE